MAAQYTTTKEGHTADYAALYLLPGSNTLTLVQAQRSLLLKPDFEIKYQEVQTIPDAVRYFAGDAIQLFDKKWLETCTVNVHEFCLLPVATQQQQLLTGPAGAFPGRVWGEYHLSQEVVDLLVPCITSKVYAADLMTVYGKETLKRKLEDQTDVKEKCQGVNSAFGTWLLTEVQSTTATVQTQKELRKMTKELELDMEKYDAIQSGPDFYKLMSGESDDVKKKWLQYAIDNNLIDTKQIPKVVVAHYRKLGVYFPGL